MIFSKSFGYTVRGILFIASMQDQKTFVSAEEIASALLVPRHFMGKILKKVAKERILSSVKGPSGGFTINGNTLNTTLLDLVRLTDGSLSLVSCVMRLKECDASHPCPMHGRIEGMRTELKSILSETTIGDLLNGKKDDLIKSLS